MSKMSLATALMLMPVSAQERGEVVMKYTIGDDGKWHRMPFIRTGNSDRPSPPQAANPKANQ